MAKPTVDKQKLLADVAAVRLTLERVEREVSDSPSLSLLHSQLYDMFTEHAPALGLTDGEVHTNAGGPKTPPPPSGQ